MTQGYPLPFTPAPSSRVALARPRVTRAALAAASLLALGACTALAPSRKAEAPAAPRFLETPPG